MNRVRQKLLTATIAAIMVVFTYNTAYSETMLAEYRSPEGVVYQSYSKEWSSDARLALLHTELLNNTHGEELSALKYVIIYPDYRGKSAGESGAYQLSYQILNNGNYEITSESKITLYGGNVLNTVEKIAHSLSKQYGKHFTQYYILKKENILLGRDGLMSKYAELRQLPQHLETAERTKVAAIIEDLAADDYVQLFGSPLAKKHYSFPNLIDQFEKNPNVWNQPEVSSYMFNVMPQSNLDMPLANDVNGLRAYLASISNIAKNSQDPKIIRPRLYVAGIQQLTNQKSSVQVTLAWDTPVDRNQRLNYTLVTYGKTDHQPFPIITYDNLALEGKTLTGRYGSAISRKDNRIHYNKHIGFYGEKTFVVFASDRHGNIVSSNKLTLDLSKDPIELVSNQVRYQDMKPSHWGYQDLSIADGYQIISGYPDNTFRPENQVTRAELLSILYKVDRFAEPIAYPISVNQEYVEADHWIVPTLNDAIRKKIVKQEHYGNHYQDFVFDETITREEVAMLCSQILHVRGYGAVNSQIKEPLTDIKNSLYIDDINLILQYNIVKGFPDGTFRPLNKLTRAEAVVIANRLMQIIRAN